MGVEEIYSVDDDGVGHYSGKVGGVVGLQSGCEVLVLHVDVAVLMEV